MAKPVTVCHNSQYFSLLVAYVKRFHWKQYWKFVINVCTYRGVIKLYKYLLKWFAVADYYGQIDIHFARVCNFFFLSFSSIAFVSLCNLMRAILDHSRCKWTVTIYGNGHCYNRLKISSIKLSNWPIYFSFFIDSAVGSTWCTNDHQYQFLLSFSPSFFKFQAIRHNLTKKRRVHYIGEHKKNIEPNSFPSRIIRRKKTKIVIWKISLFNGLAYVINATSTFTEFVYWASFFFLFLHTLGVDFSNLCFLVHLNVDGNFRPFFRLK